MKKNNKKAIFSTALAAAVLLTGTSFSPLAPEKNTVSAETSVLKYEFENGSTSGGKIHTGGRGNSAALQKLTIAPVGFDQTETGDSVAGVNSQNPHYRPPLAMCQ